MSALTNKIAAEHQFVWLEVDEGDVTTAVPNCSCGIYLHETHASHVAEVTEAAVLASVKPEPMPWGEFDKAVTAERQRQIQKGYDAAHDDERGTRHLFQWAVEYARRGERVKFGALLEAIWEHLERRSGTVKPSREAVARALGNARWGDQWFGVPDISLLRQADAILASDLLPGKTEAEVREQVAAEIKDAKTAVIKGTRRIPRDVLFAYDDAEDIAREGGTSKGEPLPEVAHKGPHDTDASMFATAADNLDRGYPLGGSNLTDAVVRLIRREVAREGGQRS